MQTCCPPAAAAVHPELADNEFYVTGESYAGHYVPAVAHAVYRARELGRGPRINLKVSERPCMGHWAAAPRPCCMLHGRGRFVRGRLRLRLTEVTLHTRMHAYYFVITCAACGEDRAHRRVCGLYCTPWACTAPCDACVARTRPCAAACRAWPSATA